MRVHRLELTAFGPFPGSETIDLDELNAAGIFLLTGPTGAGKSTILDAICFGLYGSVPGDRNAAKDLRSHHASPTTAPQVEIDVTIRGRRFQISRSPAWSRPSSRAASGYSDQHARATMRELVDGDWVPISNRLDEVGHLVTSLLGMNREQFCQVVMLPQGQFQTFLQAGARDRHDVLEALFATGRFVRIEKWLADHRRSCERAYADHEAGLRALVARIHEVCAPPPDDATLDLEPDAVVDWHDVAATVAAWHDSTSARLDAARTADEELRVHAKAARHALDAARELVGRHERIHDARRTLDELDSSVGEVTARTDAIARARVASTVHPFVQLTDEARAQLERATDTVTRRTRDLCRVCPEWQSDASDNDAASIDLLEAWVDRQRTELASVEALGPAQQRVDQLDREIRDLQSALATAEAEVAAARSAASELPALLETARQERDHARVAAAGLATAEAAHADATTVADAARLVDDRSAVVTSLADTLRERQSAALDAREVWLSVRERHLAGQAALLAAGLVDGQPCAVCGSTDHPQPATFTADHSTADQVRAAEGVHAEAERLLSEARELHTDAANELAALRASTRGLSPAAAVEQLVSRTAAVDCARAAATAVDELENMVTDASERLETLEGTLTEARAAQSAITARLDERQHEVARQRAALHSRLGDAESVEARASGLHAVVEAAAALLDARRDQHVSARELDVRISALADKLDETGFDRPETVMSALMTKADIANAETLNRAAADARAAATKSLAEPALVEAAAQPVADVDALEAALSDADSAHRSVSQDLVTLARRLDRLGELSAAFADEVAALHPLAEARDLATRLAAMCAGTSADNVTRTKLSHFVLSARLRQVVDAANVRLATIAGGRYVLASSLDRGVGDARGGLGLQVVDSYTGASRDPVTLSGGETFYVSLALALGLADLVRDEIGGAELSTLFVDEGFGTLDADTLDEVMDELDTLRSGGRSVGIVSHLPDLKLRIPAQVEVLASPSGSRIASP